MLRHVGLMTVLALGLAAAVACGGSPLPSSLTDQEFWTLVESLSEPAGTFALSENLVSNEAHYADRVRSLRQRGGVYMGVGPEQNYSYIARLRPAMAFIVDIRTENRNLHLLYKALFELSTDRGEFVARLFSRSCEAGLEKHSRIEDIFAACAKATASPERFATNLAQVRERLVGAHGFPLSQSDLDGIERASRAFFSDGPDIHFWGKQSGDGARPSYRSLMLARDRDGNARSYLASDDGFRFVKNLHSRNLIVPVVGDFGGNLSIRRTGDYVRARGETVSAFYASNVVVYLTNEQTATFCKNLASLPASPSAAFVQNDGVRPLAAKVSECSGGVK